MKPWDKLDSRMQNEAVRPYYEQLCQKTGSRIAKRLFDLLVSLLLLILLSPVFLGLALWIKADSRGPVFFRQVRITTYGREFRIFKFRTMVADASKLGAAVTVKDDQRITKVGRLIRRTRLDEIPQLINVLKGEMSFVGTRPEVPKYVAAYTDEMMATLLLPAGITSSASIAFKDEERLLDGADDPDDTYIHQVLPQKMVYNLNYLREFRFFLDLAICFKTVKAVSGD